MHHNFDDSDSGYDVEENKSKPFGIGGYKGRIIFLGDGTEVLTDSDDAEMFDNSEEDKDLASQVSKSSPEQEDGSSGSGSGPPPRAPSPPPRGNNKGEDAKSEQSATKDTPTETKTESGHKEDAKEVGKSAASTETKA